MSIEWVKSAAARRVISYLTDPRPAWLWSGDGADLIWSNPAAGLFRARNKKHGLKRAAPTRPIKGQVARLIRLGSLGRASLSRMQFLVGEKPVSLTCTAMPVALHNGEVGLAIVAVDPIDKDLLKEHGLNADVLAKAFGSKADFALFGAEGTILGASPNRGNASIADLSNATLVMPAGPGNARIAFFLDETAADDAVSPERHTELPVSSDAPTKTDIGTLPVERAQGTETLVDVEVETNTANEDEITEFSNAVLDDAEQDSEAAASPDADDEDARRAEATLAANAQGLTELLDRLVNDEALFAPLGPEDDTPPEQTLSEGIKSTGSDAAPLWQIIGRNFIASEEDQADNAFEGEAASTSDSPASSGNSRYNFEELSRILVDRVGGDRQSGTNATSDDPKPHQPSSFSTAGPTNTTGELVNLSDESLVLNRLPLGILIFRDQDILFANRALTDLVGFPSSGALRKQGLATIFPSSPASDENTGPVTRLAHRDGHTVPVTARLQTVSWQGRPAFMLSARTETPHAMPELAVRSFAETFADAENSGFVSAGRSGLIETASMKAVTLLGAPAEGLIGTSLSSSVIDAGAVEQLRTFLEAPARFAGSERPSIRLKTKQPQLDLLLFSEGQAGIVTGYFGILKLTATPAQKTVAETTPGGVEPAILARLARALRRPLNTIIGFSELIRSAAFGPIENTRYVEYARDIKVAGQGIVSVIDEFEDIIRLHTGEFAIEPHEFDLAKMLDSCIARVRGRAGDARVFLRSAISERLPRINADSGSMSQAILNLLASAIDQTLEGGQIVISAQIEDDGSVTINVRDSGKSSGNVTENFVVFRDGQDRDGEPQRAVQSSIGLALTRSLVSINTCTLTVEPTFGSGTLFSLSIPSELTIAPSED